MHSKFILTAGELSVAGVLAVGATSAASAGTDYVAKYGIKADHLQLGVTVWAGQSRADLRGGVKDDLFIAVWAICTCHSFLLLHSSLCIGGWSTLQR